MKVKALQDKNFQQLENFIAYEKYLSDSYFTQFIFEYLERGKSMLNNFILPQGSEPVLDIYTKGLSFKMAQEKLHSLDKVKVNRTQDSKQMQPKTQVLGDL
jgi:hypothetical protein